MLNAKDVSPLSNINTLYLEFCHHLFPLFVWAITFAFVKPQECRGYCEAVPTWLVSVQWTGLLGSTWPLVPS